MSVIVCVCCSYGCGCRCRCYCVFVAAAQHSNTFHHHICLLTLSYGTTPTEKNTDSWPASTFIPTLIASNMSIAPSLSCTVNWTRKWMSVTAVTCTRPRRPNSNVTLGGCPTAATMILPTGRENWPNIFDAYATFCQVSIKKKEMRCICCRPKRHMPYRMYYIHSG